MTAALNVWSILDIPVMLPEIYVRLFVGMGLWLAMKHAMTGLLLLDSLVASLVAEILTLGTIVLEDLIQPEPLALDFVRMELLIQREETRVMTEMFSTGMVAPQHVKRKLDSHVPETQHLFQYVQRFAEMG